MAQLQRILFPSRRLNAILQQLHFKSAYKRGRKSNEQCAKAFSTNLFATYFTKKGERESRQFCTLVKEVLAEKEPEDALYQEFESFNQVDLSSDDLINTFNNLLHTYKSLRRKKRIHDFDDELQEFVKSDSFVNYCNALERRLPLLSALQLKLLLSLNLFRVPPTCALMQKIYHLIIEKINDYTPTEALSIFQSVCNLNQTGNYNTRVLQLVCKQYFEAKLFGNSTEKLDYNHIAFFCNSSNLGLHLRKKLLSLLVTNFKAKHSELDITGLCRIFGAFREPTLASYFKSEMLEILKKRIVEKPSHLSTVNVLRGYQQLLFQGYEYDKNFLDSLLEVCLELKQVIPLFSICDHFLLVEHNCQRLVKHAEQQLIRPEFTLTSVKFCYKIAQILAAVYYHPTGYTGDDTVHKECLQKLDSFDYKMSSVRNFVNWCLFNTVLGSPKRFDYINQLFSYLNENFGKTEQVLSESVCEEILSLNAFARRYFPTEVSELPKEFLERCFDVQNTQLNRTLNNKMRSLFHEKVQKFENCTTSLDQFINVAVVSDQDNNSEKASDSQTYSSEDKLKIEDIKRSPTSELTLFQMYWGEFPCDFRNSQELPGQMQLRKQTYKPLNCRVFFLHGKIINRLKEPALENYIAAKVGKLHSSQS